MIDIQFIALSDLTLEYIAREFDVILTCGKFWAMELKPLLKLFFNKEIRFVFVPHGNSDKEALLNKPVDQDIDLVYGPQMHTGKIGTRVFEIGNLRLWFYKKHKEHFDQLAESFFSSGKKTVLYAPTWETKATNTSFFKNSDKIIEELNDSYNLLIKLHPLLEENNPAQFYQILGKYENHVQFILHFPAIYPLLEKTDIYLGDYSSIGYDFLAYDRPMFFLSEGGALQVCGERFNGSVVSNQEDFSSVRKKMYKECFGKERSKEKIRALFLEEIRL